MKRHAFPHIEHPVIASLCLFRPTPATRNAFLLRSSSQLYPPRLSHEMMFLLWQHDEHLCFCTFWTQCCQCFGHIHVVFSVFFFRFFWPLSSISSPPCGVKLLSSPLWCQTFVLLFSVLVPGLLWTLSTCILFLVVTFAAQARCNDLLSTFFWALPSGCAWAMMHWHEGVNDVRCCLHTKMMFFRCLSVDDAFVWVGVLINFVVACK